MYLTFNSFDVDDDNDDLINMIYYRLTSGWSCHHPFFICYSRKSALICVLKQSGGSNRCYRKFGSRHRSHTCQIHFMVN